MGESGIIRRFSTAWGLPPPQLWSKSQRYLQIQTEVAADLAIRIRHPSGPSSKARMRPCSLCAGCVLPAASGETRPGSPPEPDQWASPRCSLKNEVFKLSPGRTEAEWSAPPSGLPLTSVPWNQSPCDVAVIISLYLSFPPWCWGEEGTYPVVP